MSLTRRKLLTGAALTAGLATAAGCTSRSRKSTGDPLDHVIYLTVFGAFGREAYPWVADAKGFFADAGIQCTIQPGKASDYNLKVLTGGQADFIGIDFTGALQHAGNGRLGDIRAVLALQQHTEMSIMAPAGGRITQPADLAGKTIAVQQGSVLKAVFNGYAKLANFNPAAVRWREVGDPNLLLPLIAAGKVDAVALFAPGEPGVRAAIGGPVTVLPYSDYMTGLYGNAVLTTFGMIQNNPDLVRRFTTALLKGLLYAVDNPVEAGEILHRAVPATNAKTAAAELDLMKSYVGTPPGVFEQSRVAQGIALLQSLRLVPAAFDPAQAVAFTMLPSPSPVGAR